MQSAEIELLIVSVAIISVVIAIIVFSIWDYDTIADKLF